ncbi:MULTISPECIES: hypothetical protein [unclassified Pseudomonas]|uniref:hypothetical protein n=1 Tax=unclassified Pseudomonas TaxID=196821 RepID=UPI00111BDDDC|nr:MULTISPECIES: hypothetical protein [unclassified Pseudomonas]MDI2142386.1 hypothetical protein [Pseudomonas sp. ITA]
MERKIRMTGNSLKPMPQTVLDQLATEGAFGRVAENGQMLEVEGGKFSLADGRCKGWVLERQSRWAAKAYGN